MTGQHVGHHSDKQLEVITNRTNITLFAYRYDSLPPNMRQASVPSTLSEVT